MVSAVIGKEFRGEIRWFDSPDHVLDIGHAVEEGDLHSSRSTSGNPPLSLSKFTLTAIPIPLGFLSLTTIRSPIGMLNMISSYRMPQRFRSWFKRCKRNYIYSRLRIFHHRFKMSNNYTHVCWFFFYILIKFG